jgi:threonine aldolase
MENKFIVIKEEDVEKYLNEKGQLALRGILENIADGKSLDNKKNCNEYWVVNKDEEYAKLVKNLIFKEVSQREITETIARNCVAWDTSKDKTDGLLPEVAIFKNPCLYEKLTGEEYSHSKAIQKFNI